MAFNNKYDATLPELEESLGSSEEDKVGSMEPRRRGGAARTGLLAAAVLAIAGTVLFTTAGSSIQRVFRGKSALAKAATTLAKANVKAATILDNEDPCRDFPHLNMQRIVRNNLGNQGPVNSAQEGMVFQGVNIDPGHEDSGERVDLHINALSDFEPAWRNPNDLGFSGGGNHFMRVNLKAGREVRLKLAAMRPGTTEPMTLRRATFTFFDLDTHGSRHNQEYVKASGSTGTITYDGTELVETEEDGMKKFRASEPGNGGDNPTDPLHLTEQQLQRAVTFIYEPFTEAVVTLGSTEGQFHGRKFDFVGRPSLQCATGVEPDRVVIVESTPEVDPPTCCVVKYLFVNIVCVPAEEKAFYHFMC